jgi:hypothetical protein
MSLGNILSMLTMAGGVGYLVITSQVRGEVLQEKLETANEEVGGLDTELDLVRTRIAIVETNINGMIAAVNLGNSRYEAIVNALGNLRIDITVLQTLLRNLSDAALP